MKALKVFSGVLRGVLTAVLLAALAFNLIGAYKKVFQKQDIPMVFGTGYAVVLSGSMEPEFLPGDMVVIRRQSAYKTGDIITFLTETRPVTHRIMQEEPDGFVTKGDANNSDDRNLVRHEEIAGKVVYIIPKAGDVVDFFNSQLGLIIMLLVLFATTILPGRVSKNK